MARGNGAQSILIPVGHFALIVVALFIVSNAAHESGESRGIANSAVEATRAANDRAELAEREARLAQSKTEGLRNEVSELRGMILGKPKEK